MITRITCSSKLMIHPKVMQKFKDRSDEGEKR